MANNQARRNRVKGQGKRAKRKAKPARKGVVIPVHFPPDQAARLTRQIRTGDSKSGFIRRTVMDRVEELDGGEPMPMEPPALAAVASA